jgi:hypothetical protein
MTASQNAIRDHLAPDDLAGAMKESRGVQILRPDGRPYDHGGEVADAATGVRNNIIAIKARIDRLARENGSADEMSMLTSKLSELSRFLDEIE